MDRFSSYGVALTIGIHAVVVAFVILFAREGSGNTGEDDFNPDDKVVVEAALAFKKEVEKKQPQKRFKKPKVKRKVQGVSRDANKKVDPKKKKKEKDDPPKFQIDPSLNEDEEEDDKTDEDLEVKKTVPKSALGTAQGSKYGDKNVTETKCNRASYRYKYLCDLAEDMRKYSTIPDLFKGKGYAVGCVRLKVEGKILKTKLSRKSGEANIDGPIKIGLRKLAQARNRSPKKVPQKVLDGLKQPNAAVIDVCFKIEA